MKLFVFFSIISLFPFRLPADDLLRITHLTGDFYIFTTYKNLDGYNFPSNGMYLVTDAGVVLFDTPWDTTQCAPLMDSIYKRHQKPIIMAIATHFHDDRTAGFNFFKNHGVRTYTSKLTHEMSLSHNEALAEFHFENDTVFNVGNHRFETFFPGAGHTRDNIVIWFEKEKILYGGCFIKSTENSGLGNIADADPAQWKRSVRKVRRKYPDPSFVIPGHFGWANRESVIHTAKLLRQHK